MALCLVLVPMAQAKDGKWLKMFNGKDLKGWKATEKPENWKVENGTIVAQGQRSHLFWMTKECVDCEFEAEAKTTKGSNSGMYFRAAFSEGFPKGYEVQVNNSHTDPKRTGSLYNFQNVMEHLVDDDVWFTQSVRVVGNHVTIKVNGKVVVNDYVDTKNTYTKGFLALQAHDPKSVTYYRNLRMREITPDKKK